MNNIILGMSSKESFLQIERQITASDYESLKNDPKKLITIMTSKKSSEKLLEIFEKSVLYVRKPKTFRNKDSKLKASKLSINELMVKFKKAQFTSHLFRNILKSKLNSYENVGYFYREELWLLSSDSKYLLETNKNYYQTLKHNFNESLMPFSKLIDIDLVRTNENFLNETETVLKCRNVLSCYAKRNPDIGYCQGLNFIIWELCRRKFTEEEAFWLFTVLLENVLPIDYYSSMIGVLVDQRIFNDLIDETLPKISAKFKELSFDTSLFSIQWFVCLFCKNLQSKLIEIVFDNLFIDGSIVLFKIGLVILKLLENEILKARDFPCLLTLIETKSKEFRDELYFQQKINEIYLSKKVLELSRNFYRNNVEEKQFTVMKDNNYSRKFRNLNLVHKKKLKDTKNTCDVSSLVCKTLIEYNQTFKTNYSSFIFRPSPIILFIVNDYFHEDKTQNIQNNLMDLIKNQDIFEDFQRNSILIVRHHHICKEPVECSPFSPYSPFTPVDFSKIHTFNDKFNEYNQEEKNQSFLKGYLKKSVIETRKSIGSSNSNINLHNIVPIPENPKSKRTIAHCKTLDIEENNKKRRPSIEIESNKPDVLTLKLSLDNMDKESPTGMEPFGSALFYSQTDIEKTEKYSSAGLNFKNKKPENLKMQKRATLQEKTLELKNIEKEMDENNEIIDESLYKIEPRTSMFLLQAKGIYKNINDDVVDKYIKEIEKSECINFTNEFFIERSKV